MLIIKKTTKNQPTYQSTSSANWWIWTFITRQKYVGDVEARLWYLWWREGQDFDRRLLGGHGVIGVWGQDDAAAAAAVQDGRRGRPAGWDGDQLPFTALAELLQGAALQTKLQQLGALALLRQLEVRHRTPALEILEEETTLIIIRPQQQQRLI